MSEEYRIKFSRNIKFLRKKNKLTQAELAEKLGVSQRTISDWENGTREPGNMDMWIDICDYFRIQMEELTRIDLQTSSEVFYTASDAMRYLLSEPRPAAMGGYDFTKLSDDEVIEIAEDIQRRKRLQKIKEGKRK